MATSIPKYDGFDDADDSIETGRVPRSQDRIRSSPALFLCLGLAAVAYSLDGMTAPQLLPYATSSVGKHASTGTLATAQALVIAVGKPVVAAIAERLGYGLTFMIVGCTYLLGYALVASAHSFTPIYAGSVLYASGYTALQILLALLVAEATSLRYRGISNAMLSAPFLFNVIVSAQLLGWVLPNWRLGYVILAILILVSLIPITLQQRHEEPLLQSRRAKKHLDWLGILLGGSGLALLLLTPHTLLGIVIFGIFGWHEIRTPHPVLPLAFLRNPPVLAAALIGLFDFASFYLQFVYLYPFLLVTTGWSPKSTTYALYTHAFAITLFGIVAGTALHATKRFKPTLLTGLLIRLAGVLLMLPAIGTPISAVCLVAAQVMQGWGGGFASIAAQVSAQASTQDVAGATAFVLLLAELGNCLGSAAATAIWNARMPAALAEYVPGADGELVKELFGSISAILDRGMEDPIRVGAADAYRDVMKRLITYAAILAVIPPLLCLFMTRDTKLEDTDREEETVVGLEGEVDERTPLVSPTSSRPVTRAPSPSAPG